ncbi:uncharacterized protein E5676_scaffold134G002320 [Cucumis melo var. makuwa]|uniref:Neprosin PEP catalytic domain-containing protein n=1 Tax=Cucumis melo var. makuwa TaxID=1194695 RepID=A0A5D3D964_CUCMM|nr:uncharacterized protein E5676_scaffold134G002320 [Cucumis melo var. makuwa]
MGKRNDEAVMVLTMVALVVGVAIVNVNATNVEMDLSNLLQIENKLKLLNKPSIKTIYSEDGDVIGCVDIYKQPAFDHPLLKNHTIQMSNTQNKSFGSESNPFQIWQKSGSCPKGTIPIRRVRREDLLRANSVHHFGKKFPYGTSKLGQEFNPILITTGLNYIGASGNINVWNPKVDLPNDFTASKIWLKNGPSEKFESVEAGWMVNPKLYGDAKTRFSLYWTVDSYKSTGCFDLTCSGFVQTNPSVAIGAVIDPLSSTNGQQYTIFLGIFQDPKSGNWWLKYQDQPVGYWPPTLFGYLDHSATLVEWGGEVFSSNIKVVPHTGTGMGSGDYASGLYEYASFVKQPRIVDYSIQLKYPNKVGTWADEPSCYSVDNYQRTYTSEPVFYFGGPGLSRDCH